MEKVIKKTDWRYRLIKWFYTEEQYKASVKWIPDTICSFYYHLFWAILWSPVRFTALLLEKILLGSERFDVLNKKETNRWHGIYCSIAGVFIAAIIAFVLIGMTGVIFGVDRGKNFSSFLFNPIVIFSTIFIWTALFRCFTMLVSYIKLKCKPIRFE